MTFSKYSFTSLFLPSNRAKVLTNISLLGLLAANLVPLVGVFFFKWSVFYIVLLYWMENLVIGLYNVLKMVFVKVKKPADNLGKLFMIPFFMVHYGIFTAVHGLFVMAIFGKDKQWSIQHDTTWPCFFGFIQMFAGLLRQILMSVPFGVRLAFLSLFVSHGISFVYNYLIRGEYARIEPGMLMAQPYTRVFVMHITILVGAFLLMALGSPAALLIILVGLKTVIDAKLHLHEHKKAA